MAAIPNSLVRPPGSRIQSFSIFLTFPYGSYVRVFGYFSENAGPPTPSADTGSNLHLIVETIALAHFFSNFRPFFSALRMSSGALH